MDYNIFTDGSCLDHGKSSARGGWAYIITDSESQEIKSESLGKLRAGKQTNNRAELEAMLQALLWIDSQKQGDFYTIYADSEMTVDGITGKASRTANRDIWVQIESVCSNNIGRFTVKHINSHVKNSEDPKHKMNDYTDGLARIGANSLLIAPTETNIKEELTCQ